MRCHRCGSEKSLVKGGSYGKKRQLWICRPCAHRRYLAYKGRYPADPEKLRANVRRWQKRHRKEYLAKMRKYYRINRVKILAKAKIAYAKRSAAARA